MHFNMKSPESTNQLNEKDINDFISQLQCVLQDSPPGWQAKFARTISNMQLQKQLVQSNKNNTIIPNNEELFKRMMKKIEEELESTRFDQQKYDDLLALAKLRELLSKQKQKYEIK
jgi:hypothetical protein